MENMNHLLKSTKIKLVIMCLAAALPIILVVVLEFFKPDFKDVPLVDLITLKYAIFVGLEVFIWFKIVHYIRELINVDYATNYLLQRNDERIKFIKLKTNAKTIQVTVFGLGIAAIVTAFFSRAIFYTVLSTMAVMIIVYFSIKLYYSKKY